MSLNNNRLRVSFIFSLVLSLLASIIFYFFTISNQKQIGNENTSYDLFYFFVIIFICFSIVLYYGFRFLTHNQIKKIYHRFPQLGLESHKDKDLNIYSLTKKIITLSKDQSKEIDVLRERETYRREFLGNVSHELKTPLFSIQGFVLTLIEGGKDDDKILEKYLHRVNKSVERLIYVINDLDIITDMESDQSINIHPFNITALAKEILDLLEKNAQERKITLRLSQNHEKPVKVLGDIKKIGQVLTNLVSNAINHAGENSIVTINISPKNGHTLIEVKDNGIGIAEKELNRIFERFYRVDRSRSRDFGGSGLGLSIVKHILDAHGSKIMVKSRMGIETVFFFELNTA